MRFFILLSFLYLTACLEREIAPHFGTEGHSQTSANLTEENSSISSEAMSEDNGFIIAVDLGNCANSSSGMCDPLSQDCAEGEKCLPVPEDANPFGRTICVPVVEMPVHVGEICQILPLPCGRTDNCDKSSMCWKLNDQDDLQCFPFCQDWEMSCPQGATCHALHDGVVTICLP